MSHLSRIPLLVALGTTLVLGSDPALSDDNEIYTCRDDNGVPSFQNDPCPELFETPTSMSEPPALKATRPLATTPRPAPRKRTRVPVAKRPTPKAPDTQRRVASWSRVLPAENPPPISTRNMGKQTFPTRLDRAHAAPSFVSPEKTCRRSRSRHRLSHPGGARDAQSARRPQENAEHLHADRRRR